MAAPTPITTPSPHAHSKYLAAPVGKPTMTRKPVPPFSTPASDKSPSFSFARDTKSSIARAAQSRFPSAPISNVPLKGGTPSSSRAATPVPTPMRSGAGSAAGLIESRAGVRARSAESVTSPVGARAVTSAPNRRMLTPSDRKRNDPSAASQPTSTLTPTRLPLTPRSRPLPALPASRAVSPNVSPSQIPTFARPGTAMSLYNRLSSITSSTRATVGRANSTATGRREGGKSGQSGRAASTSAGDSEGGELLKGKVQARGRDIRMSRTDPWTTEGHSAISSKMAKQHAVQARNAGNSESPKEMQSDGMASTRCSTSSNTSNTVAAIRQQVNDENSKPSRSANWLRRMGSTTFNRQRVNVTPSPLKGCHTTPKARQALTSSTPTSRAALASISGGDTGSPWISARTLAVEDPLNEQGADARPDRLADVRTDERASRGHAAHGSVSSDKSVDARRPKHDQSIVGAAIDIDRRSAKYGSIAVITPVKHRRASQVRRGNVEQEWRAMLDVEVMSAAESECLAAAECVSVYDPWSDLIVWHLPPNLGAGAVDSANSQASSVRTETTSSKRSETKDVSSSCDSPLEAPQPHQLEPLGTTILTTGVSGGGPDAARHHRVNVQRSVAQAVWPLVRAPQSESCDISGLDDRQVSLCRSATTSSTGSSRASDVPSTPRHRLDPRVRLDGDMRDDLDYLYDTFSLEEEHSMDPDMTVTRASHDSEDITCGISSPWHILPSPTFRRPYEGLQIEEGWVVLSPMKEKRKERQLRRVDTLGSLRSEV